MMAEAAREQLFEELAHAPAEMRDQLLDLYLDWRDRATEWDAEHWGFDPDRWMAEERQKIECRIAAERRIAEKKY